MTVANEERALERPREETRQARLRAAARPIRLLVADDHPVVIEGLARLAAREPALELVGSVRSAEAALDALEAAPRRPDVLSLDAQMPGVRGPRTVAALAARGVPILLFTRRPIDDALAALVHAGASGYLPKSSPLDAFLEAVRALRGGAQVLPAALRARLDAPPRRPPEEVLTPRELEVFRRLARGETVKEAAFHLGSAPSTVYTHAERVRRKLGLSTPAEMARCAATWALEPGGNSYDGDARAARAESSA
jgi:DNA-binding NarL/FixJ family response regulator